MQRKVIYQPQLHPTIMLWRPLATTARAVRRTGIRQVHIVSKPEAGGQSAPSYKYKFLSEPATTAVSQRNGVDLEVIIAD